MYKIFKLSHHNTNQLDLIPGMTAIRFDDGLATTALLHICTTDIQHALCDSVSSVIRNCCTCKSSYIGKSPSSKHPTDGIPITLNWIKVRRFGWPRHELANGSKSCGRYEKSHHLASGTYPCYV